MSAERPTSAAEALGHAIEVLATSSRARLSVASAYAYLMPPVRLRQIDFAFSSQGRPVGFVTWAYVTETVAAEIVADPSRLLALPEWNEGTIPWIVDVVAAGGTAAAMMRRLRRRLADHGRARWIRHDRVGCMPTPSMARLALA